MATTTARSSGKAPKGMTSKSEWARSLFDEGKTVAEVTRIIPNMGYAFAYGIAKRAGKADTAAARRPQRAITLAEGIVTIVLADGSKVKVNRETGKVTRAK